MSGQNTSSAVMQQRSEPHDSLDFFPTPPWATRAFCEAMGFRRELGLTCWEPACGAGHMARPLAEYFAQVHASDIAPQGVGEQRDFLFPGPHPEPEADWIVTNPPFRLAAEFAATGLARAAAGVALLVRLAFLEGVERHASLFRRWPPWQIWQFVERVPMTKGRCLADATTATAYCWIVWRRQAGLLPPQFAEFHWIDPCRKRLERAGDYDAG